MPSSFTEPSRGRYSPASTFSSVDLPLPMRPSTATRSPGFSVMLTSRTESGDIGS